MITVLYFGRLSDVGTSGPCPLPDGVTDTDSLTAFLSKDGSPLGEALARAGNRIAVNQNMIAGNTPIKTGDEIAFMSPLSGG